MSLPATSLPTLSLILFLFIGLVLVALSLRGILAGRPAAGSGTVGLNRELDALFAEITRGLRTLASPARSGGLFHREKQEEVGRLLSELQNRLSLLEDDRRRPYEDKASQVLADAARAGITLPPFESPLISGLASRK
jgi:hypothetical protein